jgi:hypothetical protein
MVDLSEPIKLDKQELQIEPILLKYNTINSEIKNILLIDDSVFQNEILFNSINNNTLAIKYNVNSSKKELEDLLTNNFTEINRIGFAFNDALINSKQFLDGELFFTSEDLDPTKTKSIESEILEHENKELEILEHEKLEQGIQGYSSNLQFVIDLIKKFNIINVDYLVCNGLKYDDWVKYFDILNKETEVIVGASNDKTGNLKYGGDWILESTNEDIKNIYWDKTIINYTSTLATNTISSSITVTNTDLNNSSMYTWPITINEGTSISPIVVTFGDDITLNSSSQYFIIGSEYITLDGGNNTVTISGVTNYPGLVQNGTGGANGKSNITIQNINMGTLNGSTIAFGKGWVCQNYFGKTSSNILITNCHSDALIGPNNACGFICGIAFGQGNGTTSSSNCEITNCSTSGKILSNFGGCICGALTGQLGGIVNIINCYSTGNIIGNQSGGICGAQAGQDFGTVNITNCYSSGIIDSSGNSFCGGIISMRAGYINGNVNITNCYSTGAISGIGSGGITSSFVAQTNGNVNIINCYSSGEISSIYGGGITGYWFGYNTNNLCKISGCYSTGNITGSNAGGICGSEVGYNNNSTTYTPNILIENCYTLGNTSGTTSGSICGGYNGSTYDNQPTVNIKYCYTLYGPIVSTTLQITPIQTDTYVATTNTWSDIDAFTYLIGTPTYNSSSSLVNPIGSVWSDISPNNSTTPWIFSTFGYSPYTNKLVTTFSQSISKGNSTIKALDSTGHTFTIVAINNKVSSKYPEIKINSSNGKIYTNKSIPLGLYSIKILQQSNYTMTNFNLNIILNILCIKLSKNEKFIARINNIYPYYILLKKYKIIKKPQHGCVSINKNSKLVYKPDKDYIGKDDFILLCDSVLPYLTKEIIFNFNIKN